MTMAVMDERRIECPICGYSLIAGSEATERHARWHMRTNDTMLKYMRSRERSEPLLAVGDWARRLTDGMMGKVLDSWSEPGYVHWYTLRLETGLIRDCIEDEIEPDA